MKFPDKLYVSHYDHSTDENPSVHAEVTERDAIDTDSEFTDVAEYSLVRVRRLAVKITEVAILLLLCAGFARADSLTLAQITKELKTESVLPLRGTTASGLASNLLAAQLPSVCSYCASEPESLGLSIDAVLRAIALEKSFGFKYCDTSNCQIVWAQSNIAIDTGAGIGLSPASINFGEVAVATPEPLTAGLLLLGVAVLLLFSTGKPGSGDYAACHPFRK